ELQDSNHCPSPADRDSDDDGFPDGAELAGGARGTVCDPAAFPNIIADTDNDGIPDYYEYTPVDWNPFVHFIPQRPPPDHGPLFQPPTTARRGTSALSFDSDNDGAQDLAEIELCLDPLNATSIQGGGRDGRTAVYQEHD